jgi:hypothetical protein
MTQTLALLLDAYRELNARKLFWISLIISCVIIGAFALIGVDDKKLYLLSMDLPMPASRFWYKQIFSLFVIGIWISWGAVILALVSTAGIFPDLIAGGSIDLYLSKPISRLRLFLTKYMGGLLFVLLQTSVFALGCYLAFGLRSGQWIGSIFLIIPLTTLMFSYVFAVCVLLGVLTRSTVAALLIAVVVWLLFAIATRAEQSIFQLRTSMNEQVRVYERQAKEAEEEIASLKTNKTITNAFGIRERRAAQRRDTATANAEQARKGAGKLTTAHRIAAAVVAVMPKTNETIAILDRRIFSEADFQSMRKQMMGEADTADDPQVVARHSNGRGGRPPNASASTTTSPTTGPTTNPADAQGPSPEQLAEWKQEREAQIEADEATLRAARSRSIPWMLSTSLAFEFVVLAWAAWVFCRRDY